MVQKNSLNKIVIICGATASGKTSLACSVAKKLGSEVISADSMNIYKGLNIGTAKPTIDEMKGVKHHLIDVVSPFDSFTVSDYKSMAEPIIDKLLSENKIPVICGGTGFYINSLLYDLSYGNGEQNPLIREKYNELALKFGNEYVFNILKQKDPESAEKLHYNDLKRVIRALEICENGKLKSEIKDDFTPKYDYSAYCIDYDSETLYKRINERVNSMLDLGLVDEVKGLISTGIQKDFQCMQGIGYKEIVSYLNGEISLSDAVDLIKLNTRHYAKRQKTFFKRLPNLIYLKPDDTEVLAKRIIEEL